MKTLVLITSNFPYNTGETFIDGELPFLSKTFDRVLIIAQTASGNQTRKVGENVTLRKWNPAMSLKDMLLIPFLISSNLKTISELVNEELSFRRHAGGKIGLVNFSFLFRKIIKALQLRNFIATLLGEQGIKENIVFYSYWFKTGAHAISLMHLNNSIKISRAHGSDLYEEKTERGYLPLMKSAVKRLDAVFFISLHGLQYMTNKITPASENYFVSYLGTESKIQEITQAYNRDIIIVSCSNLIPLKRVHLIIEALALLNPSENLTWFHFGEGVLRGELEKMAAEKLTSEKIKFRFMGQYPNTELMKFYLVNKVDLFINTSISEGIPVSMMEAQSMGIPIIATNVGGVPEIVAEGTGYLLHHDFKPLKLAEQIRAYIDLDTIQKETIRRKALENWKNKFNATNNYLKFTGCINAIFASKADKR